MVARLSDIRYSKHGGRAHGQLLLSLSVGVTEPLYRWSCIDHPVGPVVIKQTMLQQSPGWTRYGDKTARLRGQRPAAARERRQLRDQQRTLNLDVGAGSTVQQHGGNNAGASSQTPNSGGGGCGAANKQRTDGLKDRQPPAQTQQPTGLGPSLELRALGKPKVFPGKRQKWKNRLHVFHAYASDGSAELGQLRREVGSNQIVLELNSLTEEQPRLSSNLSYMLMMLQATEQSG